MAEHSGFFNGVQYDAVDWRDYFEDIVETGVLDKTASNLQVRAGSGMNIIVPTGKAWLLGYGYYNDSNKTIQLQTANGTYPRIDSVVTRYDESPPLAHPKIETIVVTGTPTSNPSPPSIVRTNTIYDLKLAEVTVKKGATSISQADIKDTRFDATVCGIVKSPASRIDTTNLFAQYDAEFQNFKGQMQAGDIASSLQMQVNALTDQLGEMTSRVAELEPEIATLTPLNGFSLTNVNKPATATRQGREVHIQIGVEQSSAANRIFTQLPQGMYDNNTHLVPGINGNNGDVYPISIDRYGRVSFNGAAIKDVYINATFILEE